jgi:hypothetical protein
MSAKPQWDWSAVPAEMVDHLKTLEQQEVFRLLQGGMTAANVARHRKVADRVNCGVIKNIKRNLRAAGYDPDNGITLVPPGPQIVKGRSYLTKINPETGEETNVLVWTKTGEAKQDPAERMRQYAQALRAEIISVKPTKAAKLEYRSDLMPAIFIGDAHIGMRAFGKETKHHDFDTGIAVAQLRDAVDYLTDRAAPAEVGLLVDVGDYTHADGHSNSTTAGTPLDVDTRHRSTMYQAAMTMRYMIGKMLEKCKKVHVVVARGNHNENVAPAIELMLSFYYEKEPRVHILPTNSKYHYIEYGNWLIGVTHGDTQKAEALAGSMARDMAQAWGRTTHRLWATGHYHKDAVKTLPGVKHKVFAALPPPDAWHAAHGFAGDGEMEMWTFRKSGGVHSTHVYNIPRPIVEPDVRIA